MANNKKGSLDDLANGKESGTNEAQDSPNAEANNEVKLKKPKIDLERVRARADRQIDLGVTTETTLIPIRTFGAPQTIRAARVRPTDTSHIRSDSFKR